VFAKQATPCPHEEAGLDRLVRLIGDQGWRPGGKLTAVGGRSAGPKRDHQHRPAAVSVPGRFRTAAAARAARAFASASSGWRGRRARRIRPPARALPRHCGARPAKARHGPSDQLRISAEQARGGASGMRGTGGPPSWPTAGPLICLPGARFQEARRPEVCAPRLDACRPPCSGHVIAVRRNLPRPCPGQIPAMALHPQPPCGGRFGPLAAHSFLRAGRRACFPACPPGHGACARHGGSAPGNRTLGPRLAISPGTGSEQASARGRWTRSRCIGTCGTSRRNRHRFRGLVARRQDGRWTDWPYWRFSAPAQQKGCPSGNFLAAAARKTGRRNGMQPLAVWGRKRMSAENGGCAFRSPGGPVPSTGAPAAGRASTTQDWMLRADIETEAGWATVIPPDAGCSEVRHPHLRQGRRDPGQTEGGRAMRFPGVRKEGSGACLCSGRNAIGLCLRRAAETLAVKTAQSCRTARILLWNKQTSSPLGGRDRQRKWAARVLFFLL